MIYRVFGVKEIFIDVFVVNVDVVVNVVVAVVVVIYGHHGV